jgi:hypothetical protein
MITIGNYSGHLKADPTRFRNLTIFPIIEENGSQPDYLTLDEALAQKYAKITEVSEGGSVPELRFINDSDKRIFLLDGEEVIGAKQNRIFNVSIMVPAGKTLIIPVSCVEHGRWHHRSSDFASASHAHYAEGRMRKMASVTESMKSHGSKRSDQGAVWGDISSKFAKFRSSSTTSASGDLFEEQSIYIEDYVKSFSPIMHQIGAVFALDGEVIGMELFDSAETFRKLFAKLVRSYGLDALSSRKGEGDDGPVPSKTEVAAFLKSVADAKVSTFVGVGEGEDLRLEAEGLTGAALEVDERLVHLSAFRIQKSATN